MKSKYPELALYGGKIKCARTDNAFFPTPEVCDGTVSLSHNTFRAFGFHKSRSPSSLYGPALQGSQLNTLIITSKSALITMMNLALIVMMNALLISMINAVLI